MIFRDMLSDRKRRLRDGDQQGGFTLAELVIYSLLLVIVVGIAGSLFLTILRAQNGVRGQAETNNSAQLLYKQLEKEIRNASWAQISDSGQLLVLQTRAATETDYSHDRCVAYYYDSEKSEVRRGVGRDLTAEALSVDGENLPVIAQEWTLARDRVTPKGDHAFGPMDRKYGMNELIEIGLVFETFDDKPPVEYEKSVGLRPQGLSEGCS